MKNRVQGFSASEKGVMPVSCSVKMPGKNKQNHQSGGHKVTGGASLVQKFRMVMHPSFVAAPVLSLMRYLLLGACLYYVRRAGVRANFYREAGLQSGRQSVARFFMDWLKGVSLRNAAVATFWSLGVLGPQMSHASVSSQAGLSEIIAPKIEQVAVAPADSEFLAHVPVCVGKKILSDAVVPPTGQLQPSWASHGDYAALVSEPFGCNAGLTWQSVPHQPITDSVVVFYAAIGPPMTQWSNVFGQFGHADGDVRHVVSAKLTNHLLPSAATIAAFGVEDGFLWPRRGNVVNGHLVAAGARLPLNQNSNFGALIGEFL